MTAVKNKDFLKLEGKRFFSLDKLMTVLCYAALITVVILPVVMIFYYAFWDGSKIDIDMFVKVLTQQGNLKAIKNTVIIAFFTTAIASSQEELSG